MLITLNFSDISAADIKRIAKVAEKGVGSYDWTQSQVALTVTEKVFVNGIVSHLLDYETTLMNEATIWARAIYPLLVLAEQGNIQAWAEVPIQAQYPHVELQGIIDGVLSKAVAGLVETPYLVVVEAKRGLEGKNPRFQLYGEILATARLNWESNGQPVQEIFGCYTIGDSWTFIRALVQQIDTNCPEMTLESSREYIEKLEAETILKILKLIISKYVTP